MPDVNPNKHEHTSAHKADSRNGQFPNEYRAFRRSEYVYSQIHEDYSGFNEKD